MLNKKSTYKLWLHLEEEPFGKEPINLYNPEIVGEYETVEQALEIMTELTDYDGTATIKGYDTMKMIQVKATSLHPELYTTLRTMSWFIANPLACFEHVINREFIICWDALEDVRNEIRARGNEEAMTAAHKFLTDTEGADYIQVIDQ